ncbi:MAG: hypothetical protein PVI97_20235 [Candidatus Thiodiazotropha sp.]|jgi:hypothetical protein
MEIKPALALSLVSTLTLTIPTLSHARNCIKGKPCGKGCISLDKTCRIDASPSSHDNILRYDPTVQPGTIIRRTLHRLPKVAVVTAESVNAKQSPDSKMIIKKYKQGQRVFVYETQDAWARVSNMQPDEWVKLEALRLK